jgi:hypothetical protein
MSTRISLDAKAYLGTATRASWGTADANGVVEGDIPGDLAAMPRVKDITFNASKEKADVSKRGGAGWKQYRGTLKDLEVTITMPYDPTDSDYQSMMGSYLGNSTLPIAILSGDGAVANNEGVWADFEVVGIEKGEQLAEGQMITFTLCIGDSDVPPEWVRTTVTP